MINSGPIARTVQAVEEVSIPVTLCQICEEAFNHFVRRPSKRVSGMGHHLGEIPLTQES